MLEIKNLSKTFLIGTPNERTALDNLNLTVKDGEFVTIIGSNGAGKSTLFNAVCGGFTPDEGSILLDGKNITYEQEHKRAHYIGRVFQDPMKGTAPDLSIEENLALAYTRAHSGPFGKALNRKSRNFFRESLASYEMGLEDRMKTKVRFLSGGQRQVVTLLMCTLVAPRLLLLDEHTAALDPATGEKIMKITNKIVKEHKLSTLMITHNMKSALVTGNRTIMMDSGKIIMDFSGAEREKLTLEELLKMYTDKTRREFDNDRMLL
ncbi:MAG: ATP-binding cassette domain-containing protein [Bacillota bacterium]|nr:ATP-binding cassette domain-containing protein [Bacillota bacterium]